VATTVNASLATQIRLARARIRQAELMVDTMTSEAWRALLDERHEALNDLLDRIKP